jgi:hypothetical protein
MTLSEGPGGVVVGAEVVDGAVLGAAEFGEVAGAAVLGPLVLVGVYCLVGGALQVVGALVAVVNGGTGAAVVGLAVGALGGAGGAGAGVDAAVAGPGCWFCGDWLAWPPTRTTVATMTMNAATMAAPIIVRPPSVLNHCVVPGLGSVSVIS